MCLTKMKQGKDACPTPTLPAQEIEGELKSLWENVIDPDDVAKKLAEFEGVWDAMFPTERMALVQSMIDAVTCGGSDDVIVHFRTHTRANESGIPIVRRPALDSPGTNRYLADSRESSSRQISTIWY